MKVHLVDGTFEIFRCFHGAPRATNAEGQEVGATRGFLHTMVALLRQPDVSHVAVAFDRAVAPVRVSDPSSDDAKLSSQYGLAADVIRALGMTLWPMIRFQADEALATGARLYRSHPDVEQVVICTSDKDLAQCVEGEKVVLLNRITKTVMDEAAVIEKFGVPPRQIPEFFALVGDVSDGLPGIPRWGAKSAAAVLSRYPTVEDIPDDASDWDVDVRGAEALATNLRERRREAILYRDLSIRRDDVPIRDALEDLEWKGADRVALDRLVEQVGEAEIVDRIPRWREA